MERSNLPELGDQSLSPDEIVGRKLEDVLVSKAPLAGEALPGLARPLYYDVVLVLEGGMRCILLGDQLERWRTSAAFESLDPALFGIDPGLELRGCTITKVSSDDHGDLILELDARATLQVVTDYGTRILLAEARRDQP